MKKKETKNSDRSKKASAREREDGKGKASEFRVLSESATPEQHVECIIEHANTVPAAGTQALLLRRLRSRRADGPIHAQVAVPSPGSQSPAGSS